MISPSQTDANSPAASEQESAASEPESVQPLVDRFGRRHDSIRISVTDRCNIRCFYCMPEVGAVFAPREQLLTFEEIHRLATILVVRCGVRDIRLTGGEPLVRRDLPSLIQMLADLEGLEDLSLTTNGILLTEHAEALRRAGLRRLNISLDTLDAETFRRISRRDELSRVIAGIDAAIEQGFDSIKLNALAIRGISESEVVRLIEFATSRSVAIRFIEFMPLDTDRVWQRSSVLSGDELLTIVADHFGAVQERPRANPSQPAEEFELPGGGRLGIIRSVTAPFCGACNRLRITADGSIRNCLFAQDELPLRDLLRGGASDKQLIDVFRQSVHAKHASHGMSDADFRAPDRPMYSIGG